MSKKSNVHPDHYKTAGRDPQGQDVVHTMQRQQLKEQKSKLKKEAKKAMPEPEEGSETEPQDYEGSAPPRNQKKPPAGKADEHQ